MSQWNWRASTDLRQLTASPPSLDAQRNRRLRCRQHSRWNVTLLRPDQRRMMKRICRHVQLDPVQLQ